MKKFIKNLYNQIKKTILNVQNKTNSKFQISNFNKDFNNLIKKTILNVQNKTNSKFQISNFNKDFNNLIKKTILNVQNKTTIFKAKNKTKNKFQISNFNKCLITSVSLLFFYLFYLLIPVLYDKTWVQSNIESQLLKEFKINFSPSSDISYRILPKPHFLIKDSKIFKENNDKADSLADIKNLRVFVSQKHFFNKEKIVFKYVKIDNANFSLQKNDLKILKDESNKKFSNKKIEINKSNIFLKDNSDETITIIKISKAFFFLDSEELLNLFKLKGIAFNIPFNFDFRKKFDSSKSEELHITAKPLKLNIFDKSNNENNNLKNGENIISFLNSTIKTNYKTVDDIIVFNSSDSVIKNTKLDYNGNLSINPFDLNLNININDFRLFKLLDINLILNQIIKTELLFNENISINTSITTSSNLKREIFQNAKINFNIINGKINFNKTILINKKIGSFELENSDLFYENDALILNTDISFEVNNSDKLFSLLQTKKKFRKPIKNALINLNYNFLTNQLQFNKFKINNKKVNNQLLRVIDSNKFNNWNKSRRLFNDILENYEG